MFRQINRLLVLFTLTLLVLVLLSESHIGFELQSVSAVLLAMVVLALVNATVLPIVIRLTLPLALISFGILPLIFNGLAVLVVAWLVPGFQVGNIGTAILITFGLTISNVLVTGSLVYREERDRIRYLTLARVTSKRGRAETPQTPGLLLLEIDGLAEPLLRRALDEGYMPTLANWIKQGSHRLTAWDTSIPSQTSSMQAGILHGNHYNIPAFRFYDRAQGRLLVSNHPNNANLIVHPLLNGEGLLREDGYSLNNWATGDAAETLLTFTTMHDLEQLVFEQSDELYSFFAQPNNIQRVLLSMIVEIVREMLEARLQRLENVQPRIDRHFPYPIVRAATTRLFPYLSCDLVVGKMMEGVSSAYTTFVSYDEVAHHSGIDRPDTFRILAELDRQIRFITGAAQYAPRSYEFVILSDHGQSMGATFRQRYGITLADLVNGLAENAQAALDVAGADEGIASVNLLLSQLIGAEKPQTSFLRTIFKNEIDESGYVSLKTDRKAPPPETEQAKTIVCASGNLAHIYFTEHEKPLRLHEIEAKYPNMVAGLAAHPGIGFVIVRNEENSPVVIGMKGIYRLESDTIEGDNPLQNFGPHAAEHLRGLMRYPASGDIVVNSLYDPETNEVAAFEELVGSHGGLGGTQNQPFILYPTALNPDPIPELVGAPAVYRLIKGWQARLKQADYVPTVPPAPETAPRIDKRPLGVSILAVWTFLQGALAIVLNLILWLGIGRLSALVQQADLAAVQSIVVGLLQILIAFLTVFASISLWRLKGWALNFTIFIYCAVVFTSTLNVLAQPPAERQSVTGFAISVSFSVLTLVYLLYSKNVRRAFA